MTQTSSRTREWYPYPLYLHWQLSPGKIRCRGEKKLVFCRAISTAPETRILLFSLVFDQPLTPHILKGYSVLFGSFVFSLSSIVLRACGCVRMHFSTVLVIAFQHCTHDSLTCATQDLTWNLNQASFSNLAVSDPNISHIHFNDLHSNLNMMHLMSMILSSLDEYNAYGSIIISHLHLQRILFWRDVLIWMLSYFCSSKTRNVFGERAMVFQNHNLFKG